MEWLIVIGVVVATSIWISVASSRRRAAELVARRERLLQKYGDAAIVEDIMSGNIRQGMTEDMLVESWGKPVAVDEKIYKYKTAHTFKYNQTGRGQFASRVMLEDGRIVGWKQR